jgi:UPF0716 family protein affecting phage T7 exclusion
MCSQSDLNILGMAAPNTFSSKILGIVAAVCIVSPDVYATIHGMSILSAAVRAKREPVITLA